MEGNQVVPPIDKTLEEEADKTNVRSPAQRTLILASRNGFED